MNASIWGRNVRCTKYTLRLLVYSLKVVRFVLVLSRKPGDKIKIGDDIEIVVVRIGPNAVRIGITAPRGLNIAREELTILLPDGDDDRQSTERRMISYGST